MWINLMLTIFVWGVLISMVVVVLSLWRWYWTEPPTTESHTTEGARGTRTDGSGSDS